MHIAYLLSHVTGAWKIQLKLNLYILVHILLEMLLINWQLTVLKLTWPHIYCRHILCPRNGNRGHLVFVLSVTLIQTSYLACIPNLWNPFKWHKDQWLCDLDRDLYIKHSQFLDCVAAGGIRVAQPRPFLLIFNLSLNPLLWMNVMLISFVLASTSCEQMFKM